jgi:2-polyprenyl-3-methyl-5-hydroxy-6-metoxy-1,4-benzoquinol methylase
MATEENFSSHIYRRELPGIGPDDSLKRLAEWIPAGATVLELGPATGYFTRYLSQSLGCTVDAVELDPGMAERVRPFCRRLIVGDLAVPDVLAGFGQSRYRIIIAADVIEHLVNPESLIKRLRQFLDVDGKLLLSVPNVAYAGVIADLLKGRFEYRDEGLLDRTHLRFYTRESLARLLEGNGFHVHGWAAVFRPLNESEFKVRVETLPVDLRAALLGSPHALCYQWVVKAGLIPSTTADTEPDSLRVDQFPVRIRVQLRGEGGGASLADEIVAWGCIGSERQKISIALPSGAVGPIQLYLADRPGFMRIFDISIFSDKGPIWSWRPADGLRALSSSHDGCSFSLTQDYLLATLFLPHAWISPDIGSVDIASGVVVVLDFGWPMSADFLAAAQGWSRAAGEVAEYADPARRHCLRCAQLSCFSTVRRSLEQARELATRWIRRFY